MVCFKTKARKRYRARICSVFCLRYRGALPQRVKSPWLPNWGFCIFCPGLLRRANSSYLAEARCLRTKASPRFSSFERSRSAVATCTGSPPTSFPSHLFNSSGVAVTNRPCRLRGIPSFAQRCAIDTSCERNAEICWQPLRVVGGEVGRGLRWRFVTFLTGFFLAYMERSSPNDTRFPIPTEASRMGDLRSRRPCNVRWLRFRARELLLSWPAR